MAKKRGEHTKCTDRVKKIFYKGIIEGETKISLAKSLNIGISTIYGWMNENDKGYKPDFADLIKKAEQVRLDNVEKALYELTQPREIKEEVIEYDHVYDPKTNTTTRVISKEKITIKERKPDTTAIIFTLKTQLPDKYKEQQYIKHDLEGLNETLSNMFDDGMNDEV